MMQNIVAGLVLVALIVLGVIGYAQEHHECLSGHGHLIKTFHKCGGVAPEI